MRVIADARCGLGEGPLWDGARLWWFDIDRQHLHRTGPEGEEARVWEFDEPFSAAALVAGGGLLAASASGLWRMDPETAERELLAPLEEDIPGNRSNDGRADRRGGFWIGTMSRSFEKEAGAIYRYAGGRLEKLVANLTVPNAICFSPDGGTAYYTDTPTRRVMRWELDAEGWPVGAAEVFLDLEDQSGFPDGTAVDAEGCLWCAKWDGWRVDRYSPDGALDRTVELPVARITCPAFGGPDLRTMFVTSASVGLKAEALAAQPHAGSVFAAPLETPGLPDGEVRL